MESFLTIYRPTTIILCTVHAHPTALHWCLTSIVDVLRACETTVCILLKSGVTPDIDAVIATHSHPRLVSHDYGYNIGKANAVNQWIQTYLTPNYLPHVIMSLDSDITFSVHSFVYLIQATTNIPHVGYLSMRYTHNTCNPEKNLWLPAKKTKGRDGLLYRVSCPLFCNVAGGILSIPIHTLSTTLNFELYPNAQGKVYYSDDASLYDTLKPSGLLMGYLNGTEATHLRSDSKTEYDNPRPWNH